MIYKIAFPYLILSMTVFLVGRAVGSSCLGFLSKNLRFFLEPCLGFAALTLISTYISWIIRVDFTLCITTTVILGTISLYALYREAFFTDLLIYLLFSTTASLPILMPVLQFGCYNPFTDIFTYLVHAQWLQTHPFSYIATPSNFYPATTQITMYQQQGFRMGASFFLAFIQGLFQFSWSYDAYPIAVCVAFTSGCLLIAGLIFQISQTSRATSLFLSLLTVCLPNGFLFGAQWGFFPQTFGLTFMAGAIYLIPQSYSYILNQKYMSIARLVVLSLPLALLMSAYFLCYNDMIMLFLVCTALYSFVFFAKNKYNKNIIKVLYYISIAITITAIFVNPELKRFIISFRNGALKASAGAISMGWPVNFSAAEFLAYSFGLKLDIISLAWPTKSQTHYFFPNFIFPLILAFVFFKYFWQVKTVPDVVILIITINIIFLLAFIKFRYFTKSFDESAGMTFIQFKLMKWLAPCNISLLVGMCAFLLRSVRRVALVYGTLSIIMMWRLYTYYKIDVPNMTNDFLVQLGVKKSGFDEILSLRKKVELLKDVDLLILDIPFLNHKLTQLVAYILNDKKILGSFKKDGYIYGQLPDKELGYDLKNDFGEFVKGKKVAYIKYDPYNNSQRNEDVRVGNFCIQKNRSINLESMYTEYPTEMDCTGFWDWVNLKLIYKIIIFKKCNKVKITFEYLAHPLKENAGRRIFVALKEGNHALVSSTFVNCGQWAKGCLTADDIRSEAELEFTSEGAAIPLGAHDRRLTRFIIKNIKIELL